MRALDDLVYYATAPIRLFGRSRAVRIGAAAAVVIGIFFAVTLWALDHFFPPDNGARAVLAKLPKPPPLPPVTRTSYVIAPVAVSLVAIRASLDNAAPREFSGKNDNPVSKLLSKADIGITLSRGTMTVTGTPNEMTVNAPLTGTLKVTAQLATQAGNLTNSLAGLIDQSLGKQLGNITGQVLNQNAEIRGNVVVKSKPALKANWRLEPNLTATLGLGDSALNIAGIKVNMTNEARPLIDKAVSEQVAALEQRLRNDPSIERAAREEWAKMCRSIPLGGGKTGMPQLYLEMRPVRAAAAQPQVDARNVTLTIGVQAETRISPAATKPTCPFPAQLELVPPMDNGKLAVGVPIDVPFTEINKLLEAQLKGRHFPEDKNAAVDVEVKKASLAAAGDRLLIALHVKAREKKSWFGFGGDADVLVWGKPVLDPKNQILRLTDISLAIESQTALLGAAARAATPYLEQALADNAKIDLKPFAADAKAKIAAALTEFQKNDNGVRVDAAVNDVRLTGIAFDATTLRVIAEADGTARASVTRLP
ncbi:MAG TPA: DUF4403 family protein [Pseudolabrys sp.]|nr:DUF4403 family protein [Pseudolabrys sp.]